jgi:hypothetical protein
MKEARYDRFSGTLRNPEQGSSMPCVSADYHTFISDDHHGFIYHKKTGLPLSRFLTVNRVIPFRVMSMDCSSLYVLTVFSVPI